MSRLNILLAYPENGQFTGWPWLGMYMQGLMPAVGEKIPVIILDQPGKVYSAAVIKVDKARWCYTCQIVRV